MYDDADKSSTFINKGEIINKDKFLNKDKLTAKQQEILESLNKNEEKYGKWINSESGHYKATTEIFLRKGIEKDKNYSFLLAVFNVRGKKKTVEDILEIIVSKLTPELFIDLNCGDIFKYFLPSNIENEYVNVNDDNSLERKYIFENVLKWCKAESNASFIENFMKSKEIVKMNVDQLIKIFIDKNDDFYKYKHIFDIYYSLENYKKYICDIKVQKDYLITH